ncbi:MAG: hypothetical protein K8S97_08910 [Anaerolineae bacterium]|nr:hypothetical protein [Anaerolineae bacterium]
MTTHNKAALVAKIKAAFAAREYPGDANLVKDEQDWEAAEYADAFKGRQWQSVTVATMAYEKSALSFFTPAAYQYYMPAFMVGCLEHFDDMGDAVAWLVYGLTPQQVSLRDKKIFGNVSEDVITSMQAWFEEKIAGFIPEEKAAIREFLEYMRDTHDNEDARLALDSYWNQF